MQYISSYTGELIDSGVSVGLNILQVISYMNYYEFTSSLIQSPEWEFVITDSDDRILAGKRVDGSIFIAEL
jgi:hypothetical protein